MFLHSFPPEEPADISEEQLRATGAYWPLNATQEELDEAMSHDPTMAHETSGSDIDASRTPNMARKGARSWASLSEVLGRTAIGTAKLKAKAGLSPAKNRLGVVQKPGEDLTSSPVEFKSRYHRQKGHVYITTKATTPCVAFSTDSTIER
jgi:hypothetical protein